jgi:hypothetical protein
MKTHGQIVFAGPAAERRAFPGGRLSRCGREPASQQQLQDFKESARADLRMHDLSRMLDSHGED